MLYDVFVCDGVIIFHGNNYVLTEASTSPLPLIETTKEGKGDFSWLLVTALEKTSFSYCMRNLFVDASDGSINTIRTMLYIWSLLGIMLTSIFVTISFVICDQSSNIFVKYCIGIRSQRIVTCDERVVMYEMQFSIIVCNSFFATMHITL